MSLRRIALLGFAAVLAASSSASAESKQLHQLLFSSKAAKAEETVKPAKKVKLKASAKAKKPKGELPGVAAGIRKKGEEADAPVMLTSAGNEGELRSETQQPRRGLFASLFGGSLAQPEMLPETRALDSVLAQKEARKKFKVKDAFVPQEVEFSGYPTGSIVIDTKTRFLYLVESRSTARRYAIAVGREGLLFTGKATIGDKQEWPRWIPTLDMQKREPKHYGQYKDGMAGSPENPLGARAIYLYQGKHDTHIRIHGTNQPQSIGSAASNGCFRMINAHVIDLYNRVKLGTPVIVL